MENYEALDTLLIGYLCALRPYGMNPDWCPVNGRVGVGAPLYTWLALDPIPVAVGWRGFLDVHYDCIRRVPAPSRRRVAATLTAMWRVEQEQRQIAEDETRLGIPRVNPDSWPGKLAARLLNSNSNEGYGTLHFWRFLNSVSESVGSRQKHRAPKHEEFLTSLLGELLSPDFTREHNISYPLAPWSLDSLDLLSKKGDTLSLEVHEHSRHFESNQSGADIGVIVETSHAGKVINRRGFLLQAKRLFSSGKGLPFGPRSYFHKSPAHQAAALRRNDALKPGRAVFYLLYCPTLPGFEPQVEQEIRELEKLTFIPRVSLPLALASQDHQRAGATERLRSEMTANCTESIMDAALGIRVAQFQAFDEIGKQATRVNWRELYINAALSDRVDGWLGFARFADFMLWAIETEGVGSEDRAWIRRVEGKPMINEGTISASTSDPDDSDGVLESPVHSTWILKRTL